MTLVWKLSILTIVLGRPYTVRPMHILFRPCGLTLNKRNDRQRSPTAIMQRNSSMCMRRVRINVMGVVLSIKDRRKRISGRGLCEKNRARVTCCKEQCCKVKAKTVKETVLNI